MMLPARAVANAGTLGPPSALALAKEAVRTLHPAYFAMVMATGMVAISASLLDWPVLAKALTGVNIGAFVLLSLMTLLRVAFYPARFFADLIDHNLGVGMFTIVAGVCVLATQLIVVWTDYRAGVILWIAGLLLWAGMTYAIFTAFTVKERKPALADGIHGGWLVAVVATQSVANLGALLLPGSERGDQWVLFLSLSLWLCGGMLYIWMISIIFYRYTFFTLSPSDLMPPYWINMGAMAISSLAGTTLIANAHRWSFLEQLRPFLTGFTVLFWATATWWIPMLVILGFWRHGYKKFKVAYDPLYWGAVFPLAMYAVCTFHLAKVTGVDVLFLVSRCFFAVALAAWALTSFGLVRSVLRGLRGSLGVAA